MKMKVPHKLILAAAIMLGSSAHASITLFTDNFNTNGGRPFDNIGPGSFNDFLANDQGGTLATKTYSGSSTNGGAVGGFFYSIHGYLGTLYIEGADNSKIGLNHNFATNANDLDLALKIDFTLSVGGGGTTTAEGVSFGIGNAAIADYDATGNMFSSFFLAGNQTGTRQYAAGNIISSAINFTDGDLFTYVISDASGTGSAFDGSGNSIVKFYINNVLQQTFTGLTFGANDGFINMEATGNVNGFFDNLSVQAVPEPSAALLGGLGLLAMLRRRR
jgi:MYXO-CTERM domain-containing protein